MPKVPYNRRSDGRYYKQITVGYDENGKRIVKTLNSRNGESWQSFDKRVRETETNAGVGRYVQRDLTLGEVIDLWWTTKRDLKAASVHSYRSDLKHLAPINGLKIKEVKPFHIQLIINGMTQETSRRLYSRLKNIYTYAVKNHFADQDICGDIVLPKKRKKSAKRRALTEDERKAVIKAIPNLPPLDGAFLAIAFYTGMRRGEIYSLTKNDIDLDKNTISVSKTLSVEKETTKPRIQNETKSEAGMRAIPIPEPLKEILAPYVGNLSTEELFLTSNGTLFPRSLMHYHWHEIICKEISRQMNGAEVEFTPHYLRHNYATELIEAGLNVKEVQYLMGHESLDMTLKIYAEARINHKKVLVDLNRAFA